MGTPITGLRTTAATIIVSAFVFVSQASAWEPLGKQLVSRKKELAAAWEGQSEVAILKDKLARARQPMPGWAHKLYWEESVEGQRLGWSVSQRIWEIEKDLVSSDKASNFRVTGGMKELEGWANGEIYRMAAWVEEQDPIPQGPADALSVTRARVHPSVIDWYLDESNHVLYALSAAELPYDEKVLADRGVGKKAEVECRKASPGIAYCGMLLSMAGNAGQMPILREHFQKQCLEHGRCGDLNRFEMALGDPARHSRWIHARCDEGHGGPCRMLTDKSPPSIQAMAARCQRSNWMACDRVGFMASNRGEYARAWDAFEKACAHNAGSGCYNLLELVQVAHRSPRGHRTYDIKSALKLACKAGYESGCSNLKNEEQWEGACASGQGDACAILVQGQVRAGNLASAKKLLARACKLDPKNCASYKWKALWPLNEQGDIAGTISALQKACRTREAPACFAMAQAEEVWGNAARARKFAAHGCKLDSKLCSNYTRRVRGIK